MRINEQITIIIRRHSAAVVEVYRHGVLVWKAGEPHSDASRLSGGSALSENGRRLKHLWLYSGDDWTRYTLRTRVGFALVLGDGNGGG